MKLFPPFIIGARLAPALKIGDGFLSYDNGQFVIDLPDGSEYTASDFRPPRCAVQGVNDTPETMLQSCFGAMLSFMGACAESRRYGLARHGDPMRGENAELFPPNVGEWLESVSDEIGIASYEIEETRNLISCD